SGADANAGYQVATPLHLAAGLGQEQVVKSLLRAGALPDARGKDGYTVVHTAAGAGNISVLHVLWRFGANMEATDAEGATPMHIAAKSNRDQVIAMMAGIGVELNSCMQGDMTPLHVAASHGCVESVLELLACGADRKFHDQKGWGAFEHAAHAGHAKIVELLLCVNDSTAREFALCQKEGIIGQFDRNFLGCYSACVKDSQSKEWVPGWDEKKEEWTWSLARVPVQWEDVLRNEAQQPRNPNGSSPSAIIASSMTTWQRIAANRRMC
ncbi:hypothetical protein CYMTET_52207, partial [Cymbomonas tetramitiformis]